MTVLCTDHSCIHNEDTGYYGICKLRSKPGIGYSGIDRMLVETCEAKKLITDDVSTDGGSNE